MIAAIMMLVMSVLCFVGVRTIWKHRAEFVQFKPTPGTLMFWLTVGGVWFLWVGASILDTAVREKKVSDVSTTTLPVGDASDSNSLSPSTQDRSSQAKPVR